VTRGRVCGTRTLLRPASLTHFRAGAPPLRQRFDTPVTYQQTVVESDPYGETFTQVSADDSSSVRRNFWALESACSVGAHARTHAAARHAADAAPALTHPHPRSAGPSRPTRFS
jgi:hypothetical protein